MTREKPKAPRASKGKSPAGKSAADQISLNTKMEPSQDRAKATFELILEVTGELLGEVGIERLSTNMVAQRAGLTPPALYRYFPNKYAILREMGRRLLAAEDEVVFEWLAAGNAERPITLEEDVQRNVELLRRVRKIAQDQPGGAWILRVMRAVPILREVRAESIDAVADALYQRLRPVRPDLDEERLRAATVLSTSLTTAANELMIDNPALEGHVATEVARMMALYYRDLIGEN